MGPASGYDAVNAWLLAFYGVQFTPGDSGLTLNDMLGRFPYVLANELGLVDWLKKAIRRALDEREPILLIGL